MEEEELRYLHEDTHEEEDQPHAEERSRPTTPKWWRPPIPPETYLWEELRRKRQQGGYPWTLLDKELMDLSDNLYEPVNPPPLYGSKYNVSGSKKDPDSTSLDERMIEIPPEIEIITSEGLDGLDQPDPHDNLLVDGDREWTSFHQDHQHDDQKAPSKTTFTAGIRNRDLPKVGETSSVRPLANKSITFSPDVPPDAESTTAEVQAAPLEEAVEEPGPSKPSALEQLKTKAGQVKQRISKISLPVRPKFNQWTGIKLSKRKKGQKKEEDEEPADQQVPEGVGWTEPLSLVPEVDKKAQEAVALPLPAPEPMEVDQTVPKSETVQESKSLDSEDEAQKKKASEEEKKRKEEELKRLKAEEKSQREREQEEVKKLKDQEKLQKHKEAEEQKRLKAEEKVRKEKEAEEQKRLKAEDKARKEKEKEDLKRQKDEEKQRQQLLQDEMKRTQQEEIQKAKEFEEEARRALEGVCAEAPEEAHLDVPVQDSNVEPSAPSKTPEKKRKLIDIDFTKRFKRSKTPPPRPQPPKMKFSRKPKIDPTQNQLAAQYSEELEARKAELEQEADAGLSDPQIFITQPSTETESTEPASDSSPQRPWPGENIPRRTQRVVYDADAEGLPEEEEELDEEDQRAASPNKQSQNKENLDKIGRKLKGFGIKSKAIAAQTGKTLGQTMKVVGHGIKEFSVNAVQEVKAKQEAVRQRDAQRREERAAAAAEGGDVEPDSDQVLKFRFRKREKKQVGRPEGQMVLEQLPEEREAPATPQRARSRQMQSEADEDKVHRSQLLGRAERDWESPLDLAQSRDASEEPFSGNASSRDSPPGSSMASSSIMHVRRQGVLEEIDSDEFFLRERGISEGEDEEEVNRFLVEELRQAFRPTISNALDGFDLPSPPDRPERSPRKPPRKTKGAGETNFQTFPPERPKRQRTPGYISSYINANPEEGYDEQNMPDDEEELDDVGSTHQEEFDEDEGIRRVKEELRKLDQELEDDGRYEPIAEDSEPVKPARRRKGRKLPERQLDTGFYYNTIAANEWMRDIEDQIEVEDGQQPVPPKRVKSKSGSLAPADIDDSELTFADDDLETESRLHARTDGQGPPLAQAESEGQIDGASPDLDETLDYVDEAGYAVVHKDSTPSLPKTYPRKKHRGHRGGSKGNSLKRRSQEIKQAPAESVGHGSNPSFFSLPRYTPRTFHIVPPTRPHRAYSTLRPKRPPRHKSKSNLNLQATASPVPSPRPTTPASPGSRRDEDRPSTAIGIQGRPLPPPPRPERSPASQTDLDQESLERMVNMRHYVNFEEEAGGVEAQEELCVARSVPLLGHPEESVLAVTNDINVGVQTDPIQDEEYELNIAAGSFEEDLERIEKQSSVSHLLPADDEEQREDVVPPPIPERPLPRLPQPPLAPPQLVFPTRLHLDELEVDHLRVNELTANSLSLTQLQAPHLELNTLSARGPLSVPSITSPNLTVDRIEAHRLSSDAAEVPSISIPPSSFYNLACPPVQPSLCPETNEECPTEGLDSPVCPLPSECPSSDDQPQAIRSFPSQPPVTRSSTLASRSASSADPDLEDIVHMSVRLGRALLRVTVRSLHAMAEYVEMAGSSDPECQEQRRANMQVLMCLLLVLVAGIILIFRSSGVEPRWQYFLPPSDI